MAESQLSKSLTAGVQFATPAAFQSDNWWNRNKTKLLGLAAITVSFLMADPTLKADLDPRVFSWTVRILGILALWFGFLNSPKPEPPKEEP